MLVRARTNEIGVHLIDVLDFLGQCVTKIVIKQPVINKITIIKQINSTMQI